MTNWWNIAWGLWALYVAWRVRLINMNQTVIIYNQGVNVENQRALMKKLRVDK